MIRRLDFITIGNRITAPGEIVDIREKLREAIADSRGNTDTKNVKTLFRQGSSLVETH